MVPSSFRALRWLGRLTDASVGLSLAALTAAVTLALVREGDAVFDTGLSTLLVGSAWARFVRRPSGAQAATAGPSFWWSVLFAAANGGLSAALVFGGLPRHFRAEAFLGGLVAGATFGAFIWAPALALTLLLYGLPVAWSRQSARRGLAGRERGDLLVSAVSALLAVAALGIAHEAAESPWHGHGLWVAQALAAGAVACGGLAAALSTVRAKRRRAFVAAVEAGRVERFRIDPTDDGKTLVRIAMQGGSYRATDIEEEVASLDREGLVTRVAGS